MLFLFPLNCSRLSVLDPEGSSEAGQPGPPAAQGLQRGQLPEEHAVQLQQAHCSLLSLTALQAAGDHMGADTAHFRVSEALWRRTAVSPARRQEEKMELVLAENKHKAAGKERQEAAALFPLQSLPAARALPQHTNPSGRPGLPGNGYLQMKLFHNVAVARLGSAWAAAGCPEKGSS